MYIWDILGENELNKHKKWISKIFSIVFLFQVVFLFLLYGIFEQPYPSTAPTGPHWGDTRCWGAGCSWLGSRCIVLLGCTTNTATQDTMKFPIFTLISKAIHHSKSTALYDLLSHSSSIHHNLCWISGHRGLKHTNRDLHTLLQETKLLLFCRIQLIWPIKQDKTTNSYDYLCFSDKLKPL